METSLEKALTTLYKVDMVSYLQSHPEEFEEAVTLAVADKQPYSWRAAWLLWSCMEKDDHRIKRHVKNIIDALPTKSYQQQRELFKILHHMDLDENLEGEVFDICVDVWEKAGRQPSVRYNAFKLIVKIAEKYPDLANEVTLLTSSEYLETLSKGARKSILNILDEKGLK